MARRLPLALLLLIALTAAVPAGAQGKTHTLRDTQGDVRAVVTYRDRRNTAFPPGSGSGSTGSASGW